MTKKVSKAITKYFQYEGQRNNYYKKIVVNPDVVTYCRYYEAGKGYALVYAYKRG